MPIVQQGSINTTALVVPDLYVQIVPPQNLSLNGVPTDVVGVVGTASWGPVGQPVIVATMSDYALAFGPVMARRHDMGTMVATAVQQGAANFRCVRVTDGTDTAAQFQVPGTSFVFTALYTGLTGNTIVTSFGTGSRANSWRLTITLPGQSPEVFDNITGAGAAFWTALANAVNAGTGVQRGPSQLVVANAGGTTVAPTPFFWPFNAGVQGTDGATVTGSQMVGTDIAPRLGMYALRGQGCSLALLADGDDPTQWSTQAGFALSEGIYMILTGPAGDTISNAVLIKGYAGVDTFACKLMFGDWLWWNDQVNGTLRLVSPQGFVAGRRDINEAFAPYRTTIKGQRIAIFGATQVLDDSLATPWTAGPGKPGLAAADDPTALLAAVRAARSTSDTIVVFVHWGVELHTCPTAQATSLASQLQSAGADVIVGSHAHVLLGDGRLGNAYVDYGLGNFQFYNGSGATAQTGVLTLTVQGRTTLSATFDPGVMQAGRPQPLTGSARTSALAARDQRRGCTGLQPP